MPLVEDLLIDDEPIPTGEDDGHQTDLTGLEDRLSDHIWRLNHLYHITDKQGDVVLFQPNWAQRKFLEDLWFRNVILKARQLGFSTFILIYILDQLVFSPNTSAGLIAHALDDAAKLFRHKIMFPYNHLPIEIKAMVPIVSETKTELILGNGSSIGVGTSMRGGTLQHLHVSEYGKIAAMFPEKAREIKTGAFNAVAAGQHIYVESTAEGNSGEFYDLCKKAQKVTLQASARQIPLSNKQFFHHFYPWWKNAEYREDPANVVTPERLENYFTKLRAKHNVPLTAWQKAWYVLMEDDQGDDMRREYPSTEEEAFEASVEGNYYGTHMTKARVQNRITKVPYNESLLVHTFWDIGVSDYTAIWFCQVVGREYRFIRYFQDEGEGLNYYLDYLSDLKEESGYRFGKHHAPADMMVREYGNEAKTRLQSASEQGYEFEVVPQTTIGEGIDAVRRMLPTCYFDEAGCKDGISCLDNYRKKWNKAGGVYGKAPLHNQYSHGADGFRVFATGWTHQGAFNRNFQEVKQESAEGWT